MGYIEGKDIVIEQRYVDANIDRLDGLAVLLVYLKAGIIQLGSARFTDSDNLLDKFKRIRHCHHQSTPYTTLIYTTSTVNELVGSFFATLFDRLESRGWRLNEFCVFSHTPLDNGFEMPFMLIPIYNKSRQHIPSVGVRPGHVS